MRRVRNQAPGILKFYDSANALVGTAAFSHFASYIEVKLTPGSPGTAIVLVDGVQVANLTGTFGSGSCNGISFSSERLSVGGGLTAIVLFDDLYICDTTGAQNNNFLGDARITSVAPSGDDANTGWTPNSGSAHFSRLNGALDYDTSYMNAGSAPLSDTYLYPALPATQGVIAALQVRAYAKTDSGGVDKLQAIARLSGTDYLAPGGDQFVHGVYSGLDLSSS